MGKHLPARVWSARKVGAYPQAYVRTWGNYKVSVEVVPMNAKVPAYGFVIPRGLARLLARRINQCLDETSS